MKGQISIEYLIIVGIVIFVSVPLFYYATRTSGENLRLNQADDTVKSITNAADLVYSSGLGSKDTVWVNIPSGVTGVSVANKTITMNLTIFGRISEYLSFSKANLKAAPGFIGNLTNKGNFRVAVETFRDSDGVVKVLLGGYCGDSICSSNENAVSCSTDCTSYCGDLICDAGEDCDCGDCYGEQDGCASGNVCDSQGSGDCVSAVQIQCGDGICTGLPGDNCNTCSSDCPIPAGYSCCPYDVQLNYYVLWNAASCPEVPPSVSNCGDYCVWFGNYNNGVCRQNKAQCVNNGEVYQSGGDGYCIGGPTGDFCCCIP